MWCADCPETATIIFTVVDTLTQAKLNGKALNESTNPDEEVVWGAAAYAALLEGVCGETLLGTLVLDVSCFSLGVAVDEDPIQWLIGSNTAIPTKHKASCTTKRDDQRSMRVQVRNCVRPGLADQTSVRLAW